MANLPALWDLVRVLTALVYTIQSVAALKLPPDMSAELYCSGCEAVTKEFVTWVLQRTGTGCKDITFKVYEEHLKESSMKKELHNQLKTKRSTVSLEVRVVEALETICDDKYYKSYEFTPAKMVRACKYLLEEYDEDMEQVLIGHIRVNDSQKALEKRICHMLSKACLGLRVTKKKDPRETDEYKHFDIKIPEDAKFVRPVATPSHDKDEL